MICHHCYDIYLSPGSVTMIGAMKNFKKHLGKQTKHTLKPVLPSVSLVGPASGRLQQHQQQQQCYFDHGMRDDYSVMFTWYLAAAASMTCLTMWARAFPVASLTISPWLICTKRGAVCGLQASTCNFSRHQCCSKYHCIIIAVLIYGGDMDALLTTKYVHIAEFLRGKAARICMKVHCAAATHCLVRMDVVGQRDLPLICKVLLQTRYCHCNHTGSAGQYEAPRSSSAMPALVMSKLDIQMVPWKPAAA